MNFNIIFTIVLVIALLSDFGMLLIAIFKKRFSRKFLINFFLFTIYISFVVIFNRYMKENFGIENTNIHLIIILCFFACIIGFLKYSKYLIKEEKEHIL